MNPTAPIQDYIRALPKAELHLHLEGSIELPTLARLAAVHGLPEPSSEIYAYTGFPGFLQAFKRACDHLETPQDYHLVALRMIERLKRDGVAYAEVYISAGVMFRRGLLFEGMFEGLEAGAQEGYARHGVQVRWILDAVRQWGHAEAMRVAQAAVQFRNRGVIGFGIGGDENNGPPHQFKNVYDYARRHGLRLTAHAGEVAGPESMWGAIGDLQAERLGHGVTAERDPDLLRHLADTQIPVDICLTSNVRTGAVAAIADHPLRRYFDSGLLVSLSTDDPAIFQTDLTREYLLAHQHFGFTREELARLAVDSFRSSFLSESEKSRYTKGTQFPKKEQV